MPVGFATKLVRSTKMAHRGKLMAQVLPHNSKSAATWGSGGESYDKVSESIADAIDHVVNRI
jgi:hypothetical protein